MAKYLIDLDERALRVAQEALGTETVSDTVNQALRRAGSDRAAFVSLALDVLADANLDVHGDAWR